MKHHIHGTALPGLDCQRLIELARDGKISVHGCNGAWFKKAYDDMASSTWERRDGEWVRVRKETDN